MRETIAAALVWTMSAACIAACGAGPNEDTSARAASHDSSTIDPTIFDVRLQPPSTGSSDGDHHVFVERGTVRHDIPETTTFVLPELSGMTVLLLGQELTWSFRSPRGEVIVPGKTEGRQGYEYGGSAGGLSGFTLERPEAGSWTVMVEAAEADSGVAYEIDILGDAPVRVR